MALVENAAEVRDEWLGRLAALIRDVQTWADSLGWSTRQVEVSRDDWEIGKYKAPCLLLQQDAIRVLLEPIARSAPGADGVVDLYVMPAFDDIASLYYNDGVWHVHYMFPVAPAESATFDATGKPLTKEVLRELLEEMKQHVA